jgi:hypothetical protein
MAMRHSGMRGTRRRGAAISAVLLGISMLLPGAVSAAGPAEQSLSATLDGRPLKLSAVADWDCDDFSYPLITCYSDPNKLNLRDAAILATTSIEYVTIYDFTTYTGSFMHVSQDYTVLATIGWNDRISSFVAKNSQAGHFFTDWFYGGTVYAFCCNQNVPSLGSFDNTFSSVHQG